MNNLKTHIIQQIIATTLLLLISLPLGVQFLHSIDGHETGHCTETKTHFHEAEIHCDLCDFHFQVVDIAFNSFEIKWIPLLKINFTEFISTPIYTRSPSYFHLRGPPIAIEYSV